MQISKFKDFYLKINFSGVTLSVKLFSLLLISSFVTILAGWIINFEVGRGSNELFQYLLLLWSGILSFFWVIHNKNYKAISIPVIYFFLFIDDSFSIHDHFAKLIIDKIYSGNIIFSSGKIIQIEHIGEIIYWAIVLTIVIILVLPGVLSRSILIKKFIRNNFLFFIALAFFAIFIDVLGGNWERWIDLESELIRFYIRSFIKCLEEFGETAVIAGVCIWLFSINFDDKSILKSNRKH